MQTLIRQLKASGLPAFLVVGGLGFIVDAGLLLWFTGSFGWDPYLARLPSAGIAITATWQLNRRFTFSERASARRGPEYLRYVLTQIGGAAVNVAVYSVVVAIIGSTQPRLMVALFIGSGVAALVNFAGARWFAFRPDSG